MDAYQKILSDFSLPESAVDCSRCSSEWKCCTYRPFIANFLAGEAMKQFEFSPELEAEWDFLIVGLAPNLKYRRHFLKKGKWGFGSDASLLCSFYNRKTGGCNIWSARPSVCKSFFCKSSYHEKGLLYWKELEEIAWKMEWALLEDFLFTEGWTLEDLRQMKAFLDEKSLPQPRPLAPEFRLPNLAAAQSFYSRAAEHVARVSADEIGELIGESTWRRLTEIKNAFGTSPVAPAENIR